MADVGFFNYMREVVGCGVMKQKVLSCLRSYLRSHVTAGGRYGHKMTVLPAESGNGESVLSVFKLLCRGISQFDRKVEVFFFLIKSTCKDNILDGRNYRPLRNFLGTLALS